MSNPTYQHVGPEQESASMGELVWDDYDDDAQAAPSHFRESPVSATSRVDYEPSEVLRRFPRPGKAAPVRGRKGALSTQALAGIALAVAMLLGGLAWLAFT